MGAQVSYEIWSKMAAVFDFKAVLGNIAKKTADLKGYHECRLWTGCQFHGKPGQRYGRCS